MSNQPIPNPPQRPNFIQTIGMVQKVIAGVCGSTFLMSVISLIPFIASLFSPNYLVFLSQLRMIMAATSLVCGCFIGIPQIIRMVGWLAKFYEFYKLFTEANKNKEQE